MAVGAVRAGRGGRRWRGGRRAGTRVDELLNVDPELLRELEEGRYPPQDLVTAPPGPGVREVRSGAPFDLRIEGLRRGIDIASVPRFMGAAHDLYVLPRHRLVPQPHGFEGLCPVAVGLEADGPSVAHGPDPSRADACFQAADPAARALQEEDQISVPPNVADLV